MGEPSKDVKRVVAAAKLLIDDRNIVTDFASILVTLEHLVALVLLTSMERNPRRAIGMLHEGLLPRIEERIAIFASKGETK